MVGAVVCGVWCAVCGVWCVVCGSRSGSGRGCPRVKRSGLSQARYGQCHTEKHKYHSHDALPGRIPSDATETMCERQPRPRLTAGRRLQGTSRHVTWLRSRFPPASQSLAPRTDDGHDVKHSSQTREPALHITTHTPRCGSSKHARAWVVGSQSVGRGYLRRLQRLTEETRQPKAQRRTAHGQCAYQRYA